MVYILGCDHKHQRSGIRSLGPNDFLEIEREQKRYFRETIEGILAGNPKIAFIGEEINHGEETIAREVALGRRIRHGYIDMRRAERDALGIPIGYADEGSGYPAEKVAEWNARRERHMFDQTQAQRGNAQEVLLVVGLDHLKGLERLFEATGEKSQVIDLRKTSWFKIDWNAEYLNR